LTDAPGILYWEPKHGAGAVPPRRAGGFVRMIRPAQALIQSAERKMADEFNIEPHIRTWRGFCRLMQFTAAGIALLLILMAIFLL
jgi:hypothetical protein